MRVVTPDLITFLTLCSAVWFACRGTIPCQEASHRTAALQSDNKELKTTTTTTTQWLHPPRPPGCWSSLRRRGSWWSCSRWQWRMTRTCPGGQKNYHQYYNLFSNVLFIIHAFLEPPALTRPPWGSCSPWPWCCWGGSWGPPCRWWGRSCRRCRSQGCSSCRSCWKYAHYCQIVIYWWHWVQFLKLIVFFLAFCWGKNVCYFYGFQENLSESNKSKN